MYCVCVSWSVDRLGRLDRLDRLDSTGDSHPHRYLLATVHLADMLHTYLHRWCRQMVVHGGKKGAGSTARSSAWSKVEVVECNFQGAAQCRNRFHSCTSPAGTPEWYSHLWVTVFSTSDSKGYVPEW